MKRRIVIIFKAEIEEYTIIFKAKIVKKCTKAKIA